MPWAKIVDIPFWQFQHSTLFHDNGAFPVCTYALARCIPTPSNIRYRFLLRELNHCPNFHIAMSKILEIRGRAYCTRVAHAQCIITPLVMHQRIAFVEPYQYAKFCVASSKFPESKVAYAYAWCTCIARALCMYPITKWHVPSNYADRILSVYQIWCR